MPKNYKFDYIIKSIYQNYFAIEIKVNIATYSSIVLLLFYQQNGIIVLFIDNDMEIKLFNSIKIYGDNNVI